MLPRGDEVHCIAANPRPTRVGAAQSSEEAQDEVRRFYRSGTATLVIGRQCELMQELDRHRPLSGDPFNILLICVGV